MKRTKRECWIGEDGYCHVPLQNGEEAICNSEFIEEINKHSWYLSNDGYAISKYESKKIRLHRFIFVLKFHKIKEGFCLDHININKLDNRICNLREVTHQQNQMNKNKIKGKFKGVSKVSEEKYRASIQVNGKSIHLGCFKKEDEAAYFYDVAAFHYFKEFCVLNFPQKIEEYKSLIPKSMTYKNTKATSKFLGVCFSKDKTRFRASLKINGRVKHIGYFDDELSAAKARDVYIIKHGLDRKLNFPKETYEQELNQEKQMIVFKAN